MHLQQGEMISFMRTLIPKDIPNTYQIDDGYHVYGNDQDIKEGVLSFKNFLYHLYEVLLTNDEIKRMPKKGKVKAYDETSLSVEYPFLNNIRSILINIGVNGIFLKEDGKIIMDDFTSLALKISLNKNSKVTISHAQMLKTLRVLEESGMSFEGIDLKSKKLNIDDINTIIITYPKDPKMLTGLTVLGTAQDNFASRNNDDILLRCDYRFLSSHKPQPVEYLNDYTTQLSNESKLFVHEIHQTLLDLGLACHTEMRMVNHHFMYMHKKKLFARFSASLNQGYRFVIKPKHTSKHLALIDTFPKVLKDTILKGYGCNKKSGEGHGNCQNGCAGICFPLDDTLYNNKNYFMKWLEAELS